MSAERRVVRADDSAFSEGRGCYTTVRIDGGRPRFAARHAARLQAGAEHLRLGALDTEPIHRALAELTKAALPRGAGIIRLQVSRNAAGATHLVGVPRSLGVDRSEWSAIVASQCHDGPASAAGHKVTSRLTLSLAAEEARRAGADEAILADAASALVEGARSNLVIVDEAGTARTPPLATGAVAGIARAVSLERVAGLREATVPRSALFAAREVVALNAVRGARPITRVDGRPVGEGRPGTWCARLAEALCRD